MGMGLPYKVTQTVNIHSLFKLMFNFNSSAVDRIVTNDNQVTVTFKNGRDYTYMVNDITSFVSSLSRVIESGESVGRFVNQRIKDETMKLITA